MRFVVLAHAEDDTAVAVALLLGQRHTATEVVLLSDYELLFAPRWSHRSSQGSVTTHIGLANGTILASDNIGVVFNRLRYLDTSHFAAGNNGDREYGSSEMFALLLSWLSSLPCAVINRPSPQGIGGMQRHAIAWQVLAGRAGLPVGRSQLTTSTRRWAPHDGLRALPDVIPGVTNRGEATRGNIPAWLYEPLLHDPPTTSSCSALVVGGAVFGDMASSLREACLSLASLAGLELLKIDFQQIQRAAPTWVFAGADIFPDLREAHALTALIELLENRSMIFPSDGTST